MKSFYGLCGIPVHSVLLVPDRETALAFPKRDLVLGFCRSCGFISNTVFDPGVHEYSDQYEATQGFSPTFNAFARALASRLMDRYHLRGKRVLEIGCGKGEFITLLCELGMSSGIGIDPAYVPGRLQGEAAARVEFIRDCYDERHAHLQADLVCCRHTLEHIASVGAFLAILHAAIATQSATVVCFEVPDACRILEEGAFWDVFYEHCSYFTAGSLGRLFRRTGFDVVELTREYGGQYLVVVARPGRAGEREPLDLEGDLEKTSSDVDAFPTRCRQIVDWWKQQIEDRTRSGKRVVLWGSGSKAVGFLTALGLDDRIQYVVDINPFKQGKYMPGVPQQIVAPVFLKEYQPDCVVLMNPVYRDEIGRDLQQLRLQPEVLAL
jgi:SAM-dependent methyltransferase